ncbi:putative MFS family arabinose efflux permease [Desulfitobacterium sp. LBE]|uniref:Major facilitator superfamily (MFS) profile domain-containing protein n=5 Tax=root TaxID=1 RepID=Q250C3_DESHY|nr:MULTISPECIES: MFS transporter [Desulfitobacterium]ACL18597.1 major facilitator superfamily MFS_1 [Desulfitobacterium hafniense DCB-2]EHL08172.1 transporter, major facilitator family protein [Desulfitobacterium hafniense DP7]KTE91789.1 MFS transporter [Desulfitobacterium hafniense]MEA5024143.1 MFS transporter [Desulfitobacterium hafniense]TWH58487.1 putative MFS family arabinose efflux permease [Desulfitobacterium sp. LBE]
MNSQPNKKLGPIVAIMSMFIFIPDFFIISSILSKISESYPHISMAGITYLLTSVSLAQMAGALITGVVLGRRISFRGLSLIAIAIYVIFGGMPFFFSMSFGALMFTRVAFGLGLGCWLPICQSYIAKLYDDEAKRADILGIGMALFNVGLILGIMAGGILGAFNWRYTFAFYLLGSISFVLVAIFMKEPVNEAEGKKEKIRIPKEAFGIMGFFILAQLIFGVFSSYISYVVAEIHGTPILASTMMTAFSIACIVIALFFGPLYRLVKQYILLFASALVVVSYALLYLGGTSASIPLLFLGAVCCGLATNMCSTGVAMMLSITVPQASVAAAMSASIICMNVGTFLTSPFLQIISIAAGEGAPAYTAYLGALLLAVVLLIIAVPFSTKLRRAAKAKETMPAA